MSSLGSIVVELDLDDKNFTLRTIKAGETIKKLSRNFDKSTKSIKKMERSVVGVLPRLRDLAITASILKGGIHNLYNITLGWQKSIVDTNAKLERMTFLLRGMSNATTELGRNKEAAENMGFLFNLAERAPFSLGEMTNSLVKMKSVGLEGAQKAIVALTDSVAQFGGTDEVLHRATVAIQQMAGKGVISMEELRQQLGEAVPTAMVMMAKSMNLTMRELVDAVSTGRVEAHSAIKKMTEEMQRTMGGAALIMSESWVGMMARLETRWTLFQKTIGDSGAFDIAKENLLGVIDAFDPVQSKRYAVLWGEAMASFIDGLATATRFLLDHGSKIYTVIKAVGGLVVVWKTASVISGILKSLQIGLIAMAEAQAIAATATATAVTVLTREQMAAQAAAASASFLTKSITRLGAATSWLLGPWGRLAAIIIGVALSLSTFSSEAEDAKGILDSSSLAVDKNSQAILRNQIAVEKLTQSKIAASLVSAENARDNSGYDAVADLGGKNAEKFKQSLIEKNAFILKLEKKLQEGLLASSEGHARSMVNVLDRELAKKNQNSRAAYSRSIDDANVMFQRDEITREQFVATRKAAIATLYDDLIEVTKAKMKELDQALNAGPNTRNKKTALDAQIEALQKKLDSLAEVKAQQLLTAGDEAELSNSKTGKSRLENFITTTSGKIAASKDEIAGINGELSKFRILLNDGAFGEEGKTLLGGGLVSGKTLSDIEKMVVLRANLSDKVKESVKARRQEESAIKSVTSKAEKMAQQAATAKKLFMSGTDDSFVDKIKRQIDALVEKVPNATKELRELAEVAKQNAISKVTFVNASNLKKESEKINNDLLTDKEKSLAEYTQAVERAENSIVKTAQMTAEERSQIDQSLYAHLNALRDEYVRKSETPMQKMLRDWKDVSKNMGEASARWLDSASNKMTEFVKTGKLDFSDLAESIITDLIKIQMQAALTSVMGGSGGGGGILGALGNLAEGAFGAGSSGSSSFVGPMQPGTSSGGIMSTIASIWPFANGGIMTSSGKLDMNAYALGGVAKSPQLAMFGEGSTPEAFVPLPDGRSIPVTMKGGMGAAPISVQVNVVNQTTKEVTAHQGQTKFDGKKMILDVVMMAASTPGPFRDSMRGAVR